MARIAIIGAATDYGQARRGVDMGPSAIRYAGLHEGLERLGHDIVDLGDVHALPARAETAGDPRLKHLDECVAVTKSLIERVRIAQAESRTPLVLGGDHTVALASIGAISEGRTIGILWIDAHGDFNTDETSPTGNIHGMPLAAVCGFGDRRLVDLAYPGAKVAPEHVAIVGARDLDSDERRLLREGGVHVYPMQMIDRRGLVPVMIEALEVVQDGTEAFHVSFDLDALDPTIAPGVGTAVTGGFNYREAHLIMEMIAEIGPLFSLDVVEVNPVLDQHNMTGRLAAELIWSAFGKSSL